MTQATPQQLTETLLLRLSTGKPLTDTGNRLILYSLAKQADVFRLDYGNNLNRLQEAQQ